jgi:fucose 4-O-acetylase-like acetyltransferase
MEGNPPKQRSATIDCLKGLAIFLVVWGHCIQFLFHDVDFTFLSNPAFILIYMFHMPLFMAVSGYLFAISEHRYSAYTLLKKRAMRLLLPVIVWSLLYYAAAVVAIHLGAGSAINYNYRGGLWFLVAVMFCVVVALLCDRIARGNPLVYLAAVLLSLALPDGFDLHYDKFLLPYFFAGILFWRYRSRIPRVVYKVVWGLCLILFGVLFLRWKTEDYIYISGMSLYVSAPWHRLAIITVRYLAGFAGIAAVVPVIRVLRHSAVAPPLTYLGRYTLEIYVLSAPILPWLHYLRMPHANALLYTCVTAPLVAVVLCLLFLCIAKAIRRSRTLGLLLLGA